MIDQFEELFTLCADDGVRQRFIAGLVAAVTDPRSRLRVVLDAARRLLRPAAALPRSRRAGRARHRRRHAARRRRAGAGHRRAGRPRAASTFEPGLVARIVADVVDQPGALPLLQYALTELFDARVSALMTHRRYDELGGLTGALGPARRELYTAASTSAEQTAIRRCSRASSHLGEGTEDTRRRVPAQRARRRRGHGRRCIDRFGDARLLSFDHDPVTREPTVEVAHEALIREWPRLRALARRRPRRPADCTATSPRRPQAWTVRGRDDGELYRGARLEATEAWAGDHAGDLNPAEGAFLAASSDAHRLAIDAAERSARRLRRSFIAVATVAVLAVIAGSVAFVQRRSASEARDRAARAAVVASNERDTAKNERDTAKAATAEAERQRANAVATTADSETGRMAAVAPNIAETDLPLALLLAAEANHRSDDPRTLGALEGVLAGAGSNLGFIPVDAHRGATDVDAVHYWGLGVDAKGDLVVSTTNEILILASSDGSVVRRIDVSGGAQDPSGGLISRTFAVRGNTGVWVGTHDRLWLADLSTGAVTDTGLDSVEGVELEADGAHFVVARADGHSSVIGSVQRRRTGPWRETGFAPSETSNRSPKPPKASG